MWGGITCRVKGMRVGRESGHMRLVTNKNWGVVKQIGKEVQAEEEKGKTSDVDKYYSAQIFEFKIQHK